MKHIGLLSIFTITSLILNGQDDLDIFSQTVVPSPNATAFCNYVNSPVGQYNGLPEITIPLYTINSGSVTLPISLSYHAKGVKVAEEASWVGLGWTLNAGGVITRKINSLDDFESTNGYLAAEEIQGYNGTPLPDYHSWLCWTSIDNLDLYEKLQQYFYGLVDGQPDNFYFNFLGYSGELIFHKQSGNVVTATVVTQDNLTFLYNISSKEWEVTDEKGWKYYFGTLEITQNLSSGSNTFNLQPTGTWSEEMITAWYLDRIVTLNGDEINFTYNFSGPYIENQPSYDEMSQHGPFYSFDVNGTPGVALSNIHTTRYFASKSRVNEVYLNRINFNEGYVYFGTSDRIDRQKCLNAGYSQKLDYLEISNFDGSFKKYLFFNYNYFREDKLSAPDKEKYLRLKLTKIYETIPTSGGMDFINLPPYEFNYNENIQLPAKNSFSVDHWGYFNGADQSNIRNYNYISLPNIWGGVTQINENETSTISTLQPRYIYSEDRKVFFNGADREANPDYINAASLEIIKYPAGGRTHFEFEPNDYYNYGLMKDTLFTEIVHSMGTNTKEINVPAQGAFVLLQFNLENLYYPYSGGIDETDMEATISVKNENNTWVKIIEFVPEDIYNPIEEMTSNICIYLAPGLYQIKADNLDADYLEMELKTTLIFKTTCARKYADGLRIKAIKNYDTNNGISVNNTAFDYTQNGHSAGIFMNQMEHFYNETDLIELGMSGQGNSPCCFLGSIVLEPSIPNYLISFGSTIRPISSSARGNYIGYSKVSVLNQDNNGVSNGLSVYHFYNSPDEEYPNFFPDLPGRKDFRNGQLVKIECFDNSNQKIKEIINEYGTNVLTETKIVGVKCMRPSTPYINPPPYGIELGIIAQYYEVDSKWWYLKKQTTITYSDNEYDTNITTEDNFYFDNNDHKLLTRRTSAQSDGKEMTEIFKYPLDIDDPSEIYSTSEVLNALKTTHYLNFKLVTEKWINETIIDGQINSPILNSNYGNSAVLGSVWRFENNQYFQKAVFEHADFNRQVQVQVTDDHPITTIWGYNYSLPIAKIENATFEHVILELSCSLAELQSKSNNELLDIFDDLRSDLSNSMISSYTYKPLVGMTSETDPAGKTTYYEYDDFGRLTTIRDHNGNVIKQIDYHYEEEDNNDD